MARYDVYKNPEPGQSRSAPYLLDVQNTYIEALPTVLVIPLVPKEYLAYPLEDINPELTVKGKKYYLDMGNMASIPRRFVRTTVENISAQQFEIQNALDALLGGY